jgi:hypothetical protein
LRASVIKGFSCAAESVSELFVFITLTMNLNSSEALRLIDFASAVHS